ncbi:MAG: hypothetical protein SGI88_11290 [Candidatus Hydrogenedentes bacterium]|nr:hypothetical protein [Candidatus Hydrogenedentota bacterium]
MRHATVVFLSLLLILCPIVVSAEDSITQPGWSGPDGQLARTLFLHTKAALDRIKSYSIDFESVREWYLDPGQMAGPDTRPARMPKGERVDVVNGTCLYDGKRFVVTSNADYSFKNTTYRVSGPVGACLADNYFAQMHAEMPSVIKAWDHVSIEAVPKDRLEFMQDWLWPKVLLYGFTDGTKELVPHYDSFTHPILWTVTDNRTEAGHTYTLEATSPTREPGKPMVRYIIDADRGYMITAVNGYELNGSPHSTLTCSLQRVDENTWFPRVVHVKRFPIATTSGHKHTFELRITRVEVNRPFPVTTFTLDEFGYDPVLAEVRHFALNGQESLLYRWENAWAPIEFLPASAQAVIRNHVRERTVPWQERK